MVVIKIVYLFCDFAKASEKLSSKNLYNDFF